MWPFRFETAREKNARNYSALPFEMLAVDAAGMYVRVMQLQQKKPPAAASEAWAYTYILQACQDEGLAYAQRAR